MLFDIEIIKPNPNVQADYNTLIFKIGLKNRFEQSVTEQFELFTFTLIRAGVKKIVFDFAELRYIDSSGIGKIINITKILRQQKGNVAISRVTDEILQILKLVKLDTFIKIFLSNEEAINFLKLS